MASSSPFQRLASRFSQYLEELHLFFLSYGMPFGSQADVGAFVHRISAPGPVREGVCAMVRSVVYREHETISHGDLLDLLLVAVGGTEIEDEQPEIQEAERMLSRVVGQAMFSFGTGSVPVPTPAHTAMWPSHEEAAAAPTQPMPAADGWHESPEPIRPRVTVHEAEPMAPEPFAFDYSSLEPLPPVLPAPYRPAGIAAPRRVEPAVVWEAHRPAWRRWLASPATIWAAAACAAITPPAIGIVQSLTAPPKTHILARHLRAPEPASAEPDWSVPALSAPLPVMQPLPAAWTPEDAAAWRSVTDPPRHRSHARPHAAGAAALAPAARVPTAESTGAVDTRFARDRDMPSELPKAADPQGGVH